MTLNKGKNEYSLHNLNPDQVLQMAFEAANRYIATGSLSKGTDKTEYSSGT
jgi:hypothetical protein